MMQNSGSLCFYLEWILKCMVTEVFSFLMCLVKDRFPKLCLVNFRNNLLAPPQSYRHLFEILCSRKSEYGVQCQPSIGFHWLGSPCGVRPASGDSSSYSSINCLHLSLWLLMNSIVIIVITYLSFREVGNSFEGYLEVAIKFVKYFTLHILLRSTLRSASGKARVFTLTNKRCL